MQQQCVTEKSTVVWHRKGSEIAGYLECVGVGGLVGGVQCWLVGAVLLCWLALGKVKKVEGYCYLAYPLFSSENCSY